MNFIFDLSPSSLELFTLALPKGTTLYKGFGNKKEKFDASSIEPCWFSFDRDDAKKYGGHVCVVKLTKKMVFLNVSSGGFKTHFIDMLTLSVLNNVTPDRCNKTFPHHVWYNFHPLLNTCRGRSTIYFSSNNHFR